MLGLLSYLLGLLIFPSVQGGIGFHSKDQSLSVLQDAPTQCGSFCLAALNPIFDDTDSMRTTLDEIKAVLHAGFDSRLKQELITKEDFANSIQVLQTKLDEGLNRMEELRTMKITDDANDKYKKQVNILEDTIKELHSQLKISEGLIKCKEDILKVKEERIKRQLKRLQNRDEQISTLTTQIKAIEKTKSELSSELSELQRTDDILPDFCPSGSPNGIYQIKLRDLEPFKAPCATSPPGYTVIQRRIDGSENFNRTWEEYKTGFGNVRREFFIGLEKLHRMTEARPHELFIKLRKDNGSTSYAHYDNFAIGSEEESYQLKNIGEYSGEAGDSLRESEHQKFSTLDRDNDNLSNFNCASKNGAWWHDRCSYIYSWLNGKYFKDGKGRNGIHWISWQHYDWSMSLTFVEMMIRPKSL